ncbi:hypothetical protein SERLA73DRAFT_106582 [Serpula lacrymans var. lacrymans S7.3]|uniref:Uncharacterized protein n=2 Tax=Serpula lacrymans var. lacrymans TaxID=341189 RepID=F8PV90_SERL3|nr:hypothetical protein SERLA73DRAFT_106582 [Serpula lacrymans var. lacrymans S7.3]
MPIPSVMTTRFPLLSSSVDPVVLPLELVELLNHVYFLHLVATDPSKVLPPGKSLLSMMSRTHAQGDSQDDSLSGLRTKVEDMVHKAFWDEALESLSNPEPSSQLPRLKLLYSDLQVALSPLLPPHHPVLVTMTAPLSPTSSPLHSAIMHLREVLASLRQRCAPVRDSHLDTLSRALDDPPPRSSPPVALATLVAETVKSILQLADVMKDDLSQFVLGNMTEQQLRSTVIQQAKTQERSIILDIWNPDRISEHWTTWLDNIQQPVHVPEDRHKWVVRLVQSLGGTSPVSCTLPTKKVSNSSLSNGSTEDEQPTPANPNSLPPIFFFTTPTLLSLQNYLQALVIAASLRSLTRLPLPNSRANSVQGNSPGADFMERVWSMLKAEVDEEEGTGDTKLVNLADEVVRARRYASTLDATSLDTGEESRLRAAVDRTLKPHDPVFVLLQKRLLNALAARLVQCRDEVVAESSRVPERMQTGREGERAGKRPRLILNLEDVGVNGADAQKAPEMVAVKGFEDPVLARAVGEVFGQMKDCIDWTETVWSDVIEGNEVSM